MKQLQKSAFITRMRPVAKALLSALLQTYEYASVLVTDSLSKSYRISRSGMSVSESTSFGDKGVVVKVYDGQSYAEYATSHLTHENIPLVLSTIQHRLLTMASKLPQGTAPSSYGKLPDEEQTFYAATEYDIHPLELGDEEILSRLSHAHELAMGVDERIVDAVAFSSFQEYHKLFLSEKKDMEQSVLWMACGLAVMASRGEEIKDYYKGYSNLGGAEVLSEMENDAKTIAALAIELLSSEPMVPGIYDCICTPEVTGMIVHEAFGHGVEMDMFVK
ncbi:MAG: hypothetical protein J6R42_05650, partial [Clostridia bacterium]|nr:hypothetical protein [Clostridia bacterium]